MKNLMLYLFAALTLILATILKAEPPNTITKEMLLNTSCGYYVEDCDEKGIYWKLNISTDIDKEVVDFVFKLFQSSLKPLTLIGLVEDTAIYAEGNPERATTHLNFVKIDKSSAAFTLSIIIPNPYES